MTKKQDDEWGNIELPGLSDDKLFNTNWNRAGFNHPMYGKQQTEEHKKKRSEVQKGRAQTQEHIENAAATRRGVPKSLGHNKKNAESHKGKKHSEEQIKNRAESIKKPIHTPYGEFDSRKAAMTWMTYNGIKGAECRIRKGLKKDPENFYYINK